MDFGNGGQTKKAKQQAKEDDIINGFDLLPYEIAIDTLSRLPITSLVQLSFSCKSLNSLSHDPDSVKLHLSKSSNNESECLLFHSDYRLRNELHFIRLTDNKVRKFNLPFEKTMPEFFIIGSANGLLCVVDTLFRDSIRLYNPFRGDHLELPKNRFGFKDDCVAYGFGFHPPTNDYKVVKIENCTNFHLLWPYGYYGMQSFKIQIYSLKSNAWRNVTVTHHSIETWSSPGVVVSGRLHWVSRWAESDGQLQRAILSYDLGDDSFRVIPNPASPNKFCGEWTASHLAVLFQCLSLVVPLCDDNGVFCIWIMREYGVNDSLVRAYKIGPYRPFVPRGMEKDPPPGRNIRRVLCMLKSGELLLEYMFEEGLVTYHPRTRRFTKLEYPGIPKWFQTSLHVGSLKCAALPLL